MRENGLAACCAMPVINRIVEGASEVMTAFIALVGMKGVGEGLEKMRHAFGQTSHGKLLPAGTICPRMK